MLHTEEIYSKYNMKSFCRRVATKFFISAIIKREKTETKRSSNTAITLLYILALLHNSFCCREKLLLLKIALWK
jgi:hypothetical protein